MFNDNSRTMEMEGNIKLRMSGMNGMMLQYLKLGQSDNTALYRRSMNTRRGAYCTTERGNKGNGGAVGNTGNTTNNVYDATKTATSGLRDHTKKLLETGKNSLFEKAKESKNTKEVVSEIGKFVSDYNSMVSNMKKAGGSVNDSYANQLAKDVEKNKEALAAIGITAGKDGALVVDDKVLAEASIENLEKVFSGSNSFASDISTKSIYVEANAISIKSSFRPNQYYSGYNPSGNYKTADVDSGGSFRKGV